MRQSVIPHSGEAPLAYAYGPTYESILASRTNLPEDLDLRRLFKPSKPSNLLSKDPLKQSVRHGVGSLCRFSCRLCRGKFDIIEGLQVVLV